MLGAGVEPARLIQPGDFKSPVSTIPPSKRREVFYAVFLDLSKKKLREGTKLPSRAKTKEGIAKLALERGFDDFGVVSVFRKQT